MKITILTFQFAHNYGALLQAYALKDYLQQLDNQVDFVPYYPAWARVEYAINPFVKGVPPRRRIRLGAQYFKRKKQGQIFNDFISEELGVTETFSSEYRLVSWINDHDCVICGSDQIWNDKITGNDSSYFADGVDSRKIAYAASLGTTQLTNEQKSNIRNYLPEFSAISVREPSLAVAIEELINKKVNVVLDPVFLLDEPLSNLDAKLRVQMRTELIKLHKQLQTTFVYVTHDQIEAMTMGTRIVVMKDGDIMQADDAKTLYNNPKNLFVAGFIGAPQMNFINALLNKNNDKWHANFEGYKIELNNDKISKLDNSYNGKEVILGIRPENITLCKDNSLASSSNMMEGVIDVIEMIGSESYLYMKFGNSQIIIRTNSSDDYQREQHVFIEFDLNKIHIFDKDTEENILI